jgi:hypothetical protein
VSSVGERKIFDFIARGERLIIVSFWLTFVSVVLIQFLLSYTHLGLKLNNLVYKGEHMELIPVMAVAEDTVDTVNIKIEALGHEFLRSAYILVNGNRITNFPTAEMEITVQRHDEIAVDGSFYNRPLTFKIKSVSRGVLSPTIGQEVTTFGTVESFGRVNIN